VGPYQAERPRTILMNSTETTRLRTLAPTLIVAEATGGYERALVAALAAAGLPLAVANPRQMRDFPKATGQLAKNGPPGCGSLGPVCRACPPNAPSARRASASAARCAPDAAPAAARHVDGGAQSARARHGRGPAQRGGAYPLTRAPGRQRAEGATEERREDVEPERAGQRYQRGPRSSGRGSFCLLRTGKDCPAQRAGSQGRG
jgi:hypothetical protein